MKNMRTAEIWDDDGDFFLEACIRQDKFVFSNNNNKFKKLKK